MPVIVSCRLFRGIHRKIAVFVFVAVGHGNLFFWNNSETTKDNCIVFGLKLKVILRGIIGVICFLVMCSIKWDF